MVHNTLPACDTPTRSVNIIATIPVNPSQDLIISLLEHSQSFSKVVKALTFIHKACRAWRANPTLAVTWNTVKPSISSSVIRCFAKATETIIDTNKMKHLVVQFLRRLRPQFPISYWSPTHLQEIHIGKIHHKRCTP